MKLDFEIDSNNTAYTIINDTVRGTLNQADTYTLLAHYTKLPQGSRYVETGSYLGCSAILCGLTSKRNTLVYCHDLWEENMENLSADGGPPPLIDNYFYKFYENVRSQGLEGVIVPVRGDSSYTLGIHEDNSIDLAFIDGDHSFDGVTRDLNAVYKKMKKNSFILCHDTHSSNEVYNAIIKFCKNNNITELDGFTNSSIARIHIN